MEKGYISIAEYASIRGVTTAAVYKRLKTSLKPFKTVDEKGRKCLKIEVLENDNRELPNKEYSTVENELNPKVENVENKDTIQSLLEQLAEKDKQIERLQEENGRLVELIEKNNATISDQASRIITLAEQANLLNANSQRLLAANNEESKGFFQRLFRRKKE